jgi:dTDP-4-dehydrorhamnose 3,5-epimerase
MESEVEKTHIEGLLVIRPKVFADNRGCFCESYSKITFQQHGINADFVQDNQSVSRKNVIRGLHLQAPPFAQGKLVRVVHGKAMDVAVDVRKNSPTFGQHFAVELSAENNTLFWIPEGFAHGFVALEDNTVFLYKTTNYYNKESEMAINPLDPVLNINWGVENAVLSDRDRENAWFEEFVSPFEM